MDIFKKRLKGIPLLFATLTMCGAAFSQQYKPNWESLDRRPVPEWYKDAKFGIFITWGVYSVPAWSPKGQYSEWYQYWLQSKAFNGQVADYHERNFGAQSYYDLAKSFTADLFDPEEWARLFEKSGARYIVAVVKHHDGFCWWPSKEANQSWGFPWNAADVGPKRDLLGDLFNAVRKTSVKPGLYYSLYEWYNPVYKKDPETYVVKQVIPQMKDLINTYKPYVLWTDGDWDQSDTTWHSTAFLDWLYNESPVKDRIVTYDRWGKGVRFHHGGVYTPEYQPDMDFGDHYFEESRGIGFSYAYNRAEDAWDYNSPQTLVLLLCDLVSRGGNFLLDIGPDAHGKIPPIMQERLLQMGAWLGRNGDAIYNTRKWTRPCQWSGGNRNYKPKRTEGDFKANGDFILKTTVDPDSGYAVKECFFTCNPATKDLYVLLPQWPKQNLFLVKDLTLKKGAVVTLLETGQAVRWSRRKGDVLLRLPDFDPDRNKSAYAYAIKLQGAL